jgi:hypothetical protein
MPVRKLTRDSFFDPEFVMPGCLEEGTVPWLLSRFRDVLFPAWLFQGWKGEARRGRPAWPGPLLMKHLLLRYNEEGLTRRGAERRGHVDIQWRAAMGLELGTKGPSEKRLREFEAFLRRRHPASGMPRFLMFHEHYVKLCLAAGVVGEKQTWSFDSTPTECYGAVKDTIRLLGDGVGSLAKYWSKLGQGSLQELEERWKLPHLSAKSTKGAFRINWRDAEARAEVIDKLARGTIAAVREIRSNLMQVGSSKRKRLLRRCRHLLNVIAGDLETDDQGRLVVATQVAKDRIISLTDPQARHGRKSRKKTFNGFKTHVFGDAVSGLITALTVTVGNAHDSSVAHRLIRRAKALNQDISEVLGDTAYGGATLRHDVKTQLGVTILAPPPPVVSKEGKLGRSSIEIDFEKQQATCAAGITVGDPSQVFSKEYGRMTLTYKWSASACRDCLLRSACNGQRTRGHQIRLHPHEPELRQARTDWQNDEVRERYRDRSETERLIHQVTRHGGRKAGAPGLGAANLQAHAIAMRNNLALLARAVAEQERQSSHLQQMAA